MLAQLAFLLAGSSGSSCCTQSMAMFARDPAFISQHLAPLPFTFVSKQGGKMVTFKVPDGRSGRGFFIPAKEGNTTAILVFQEWWGLNDYIKKESERLHNDLGAAVLAVDLYDGKVAKDPTQAAEYMNGFEDVRGQHLVRGAIAAIKEGDLFRATSIGTIGWCFGGGWSHRAAIEGGRDVQACVMYYGMPDTNPIDLKRLQSPVLMFWGTQDSFINEKIVKGFEEAMSKAGKSLKTHSFDAPHAFANPSNSKFNKEATETAHAEAVAFLKEHLR